MLLNNYCRRGMCCCGSFRFIVCRLYLEKRKNMCKYFSGCGYTVRKILKTFGGLNWQNT